MDSVFVTSVGSAAEAAAARLLIASLRRFGGELGACPVRVYVAERFREGRAGEARRGDAGGDTPGLAGPGVELIPLDVPAPLVTYPYGAKVLACARAEARAQASTRSLIWLDPECLVVRPPVAFDLGDDADVTVRPVHLRGVGLSPGEPPDAFWSGVRAALGVDDSDLTVESFVEGERLRAFFNSHGFAVRPALGLCGRWLEAFEELVEAASFQAAACADELHRIFLFQAVFGTLVAASVEPARIRLAPPTYDYPYNLQARVPQARRAAALDELVCFAYEGRSLDPATVKDIEIREPLRSWLKDTLGTAVEPGREGSWC